MPTPNHNLVCSILHHYIGNRVTAACTLLQSLEKSIPLICSAHQSLRQLAGKEEIEKIARDILTMTKGGETGENPHD